MNPFCSPRCVVVSSLVLVAAVADARAADDAAPATAAEPGLTSRLVAAPAKRASWKKPDSPVEPASESATQPTAAKVSTEPVSKPAPARGSARETKPASKPVAEPNDAPDGEKKPGSSGAYGPGTGRVIERTRRWRTRRNSGLPNRRRRRRWGSRGGEEASDREGKSGRSASVRSVGIRETDSGKAGVGKADRGEPGCRRRNRRSGRGWPRRWCRGSLRR